MRLFTLILFGLPILTACEAGLTEADLRHTKWQVDTDQGAVSAGTAVMLRAEGRDSLTAEDTAEMRAAIESLRFVLEFRPEGKLLINTGGRQVEEGRWELLDDGHSLRLRNLDADVTTPVRRGESGRLILEEYGPKKGPVVLSRVVGAQGSNE